MWSAVVPHCDPRISGVKFHRVNNDERDCAYWAGVQVAAVAQAAAARAAAASGAAAAAGTTIIGQGDNNNSVGEKGGAVLALGQGVVASGGV